MQNTNRIRVRSGRGGVSKQKYGLFSFPWSAVVNDCCLGTKVLMIFKILSRKWLKLKLGTKLIAFWENMCSVYFQQIIQTFDKVVITKFNCLRLSLEDRPRKVILNSFVD